VAGQDVVLGTHQHRVGEAELFNALCNLTKMLCAI
jgi:hypothetical protein